MIGYLDQSFCGFGKLSEYIDLAKDTGNGTLTSVRMTRREMKKLTITVSLHQRPKLVFFASVMHELTKHIKPDIPWYMLFADSIV